MSSVNAVIITYNQSSFVEEAIKGAVRQKLSHNYAIILHDDASADDTRKICEQYNTKYPELIKLVLASKNKGMARSWMDAISECNAKYVAICEGDDYWCDANKLQKQVDFLEANPDYAICCHRVYIKKNNQKPKLYPDEFMPSKETTYDIEMMAKYGNLIATPSVVYRNKLFSSLPSWFDELPIGDYVLHMINAQYGKIKYFPDAMAVYRDHSKGAWGGQPVMTNAANMIRVIEFLLTESFDEAVKKGLKEQLLKNKAVYLNELMNEDWVRFCKEFNVMMDDDKAVAMALIEKIKTGIDAIYRSRTYKAVEKFKKITKRST
jgi:glycosyltransferase involved in cell wall biosynthesis